MTVNAKVDTGGPLRELPGLDPTYQTSWKIRLLQIQGHCATLSSLCQWAQYSKHEYEEMMLGVRVVGMNRLPPDLPVAEKSPRFPVYAIRAKGSTARLLYFYAANSQAPKIGTAVCTNCIEPGSTDEAIVAGYKLAEALRLYFLNNLPEIHLFS